ncbi:ComEC/Rec2 family competence protein [Asticcacaulis sp. W401b]|uniref:ComEC/Rec2 family competence protein n=1 Tax=Asticcacaulis sp. W401b TaxID=3388666 RepID=UPI00397101EA
MANVFAGLGEKGRKLYLYEADRETEFRQVLWGDWLSVDGEEPDGWLRIIWSPKINPKTVYIRKSDTQETRPLEIVFLDVGQGDGAVLITPETGADEGVIVVDAGKGDNMERFLNGRFKAYRGFDFDSAVITHSDNDHYLGFGAIFANPKIGFKSIWQNGLVERPISGKWPKLGPSLPDPVSKITYFTELGETYADVKSILPNPAANAKFSYPKVLQGAIDNPKVGQIAMLSSEHGQIEDGRSYIPGYAPSTGRGYTIEVLGPVVERDGAGKARLRKIGDFGETKNGHSILLRLSFGRFSVFFGGDLNEPAERNLLMRYAGLDTYPRVGSPEYRMMVGKVAERFRSEVMKVCHHGSEKVTDAFLEAVNPACFIISSGDEEGHVHPRPDLLGRLGRAGRGASPVLLSTELQRSTREKADKALIDDIAKATEKLAKAPTTAALDAIKADLRKLAKTNVEVYGAIYLKTDGKRLITAFKIEAASDTDKWFYYEYVMTATGELVLID